MAKCIKYVQQQNTVTQWYSTGTLFQHTIKQYTTRLFTATLNSCPVRLKNVSMNRVYNETHASLDLSTSLQCQQAPNIIRTMLA